MQNICICVDNAISENGQCKLCTSNFIPNNDKTQCVCKSGFSLQNGLCVSIPNCPPNAPLNPQTNICQCPENSTLIGN